MLRLLTIIPVTLLIAFAAWFDAALALYGKFAPQKALTLSEHSAPALIKTTEIAASQDKAAFKKIAAENSVRALRSEPLSDQALRHLGLHYVMAGEVTKGRQFIRMAAGLSRRDPVTQLWIVEDAIKGGDMTTALKSLDTVLRTRPDTRETTFQALGGLLANNEFRDEFVKYAERRPPWLKEFVDYNIATLQRPEVLAQTLLKLRPFPVDIVDERARGLLLAALVNKSSIENAHRFYVRLPGAAGKSLTSLSSPKPADGLRLPPVGWELFSNDNVQGFGNTDGKSLAIEALTMPGRRGIAARKLLFLEPGQYRWTGKVDLSGMRDGAKAEIVLLCNAGPGKWVRTQGRELNDGANSLDLSVARDCGAQMLAIETRGSESQSDAVLAVSAMQLVPSRQAAL